MPIVDSNPINFAKPKTFESRSKFNLSHHHFLTARFGEYTPNSCKFVVPSDKSYRFNDKINLRTYTLKSPLMQNLSYNKDNFIVPFSAVLPINWEKVYTQPVNGDDVPSNNSANTVIYGLVDKLSAIGNNLLSALSNSSFSDAQKITALWRVLLTWERFFSDGSLLAHLNCHLSNSFVAEESGDFYDFDSFFEAWFSTFNGKSYTINIDGDTYYVVPSLGNIPDQNYKYVTFEQALELMRSADYFFFVTVPSGIGASTYTYWNDWSFEFVADTNTPFNYLYACAYHIVCEHYFTNDHVDNVYSVEKYRDVMKFYLYRCYGTWTISDHTFSYNGVLTDYDILSGRYVADILRSFWSPSHLTSQSSVPAYAYIKNIFGYCISLRYVDYFVGSRTNPLAVGNTNVPVVGGNVSVIDINKTTQYQRFWNAVNRFGRKSKSYIKGLFNVDEGYDYHNPAFVSHTSDNVFVSEIENTSTDQFTNNKAFSSIMRSNSNRFEFEVDINRPSVVISLLSFDIQRSYNESIDRMFFAEDRFDMFIPQLQFVGDQKVYLSERNGVLGHYSSTFGYQLRDSHFKQSYNYSSGGFKRYLPGYSFSDLSTPAGFNVLNRTINSRYIRAIPYELDSFYTSLSNRSLAGYFHFIIDSYNEIEVSRPMVVSPSIL